MGLFDKLFSKKEQAPQAPKKDEITIDTPYGKVFYYADPNVNEFGYEGYVDWYPDGIKETDVFIETDSPETTEATVCLARFLTLFDNREYNDECIRVKAAQYFLLRRPELLDGELTEDEIIEDSEIYNISFYRNGDTIFCLDDSWTEADDVSVILKPDGTGEISYTIGYADERREIRELL